MTIISRKHKQKQLQKIFQSTVPEFVAIYGRRRVGKTHLIREFFHKKSCFFLRSSGVHNGRLKKNNSNFLRKKENRPFIKAVKALNSPLFSIGTMLLKPSMIAFIYALENRKL
jgi:AAA+ ATPase superfamily predicted ATPase